MTEFNTMQDAANAALGHFHKKERTNGETFYTTDRQGEAPDWLQTLCRDAHVDMMPDDFKYRAIHDALSAISEFDGDDIETALEEAADGDTDIYNHDLAMWLASSPQRGAYVDEAIDNFGYPGDIHKALAYGQLEERREIYASVLTSICEIIAKSRPRAAISALGNRNRLKVILNKIDRA